MLTYRTLCLIHYCTPNATVVLTFVDEEVGGCNGMKLFVEMDYFKKLNVGFALDEGMVNSYHSDIILVSSR